VFLNTTFKIYITRYITCSLWPCYRYTHHHHCTGDQQTPTTYSAL
jgi:hypothetical protein